jgi:hypothetical protein
MQSSHADEILIEVGGVIEAELSSVNVSDGIQADTRQSDLVLATAELGMDMQISKNVFAHLLLLYEEGDTPLEIDEGSLTLGNDADGFYLTVGQFYVPFGVFDTNMVTDPITLDLAETRESAALLGYAHGNWSSTFYLFNGDTIEEAEQAENIDSIIHLGLNLAYDSDVLKLGFGYISSIGDSDGLQAVLDLPANDNANSVKDGIKRYVAGIAFNGRLNLGRVSLIGEYVAALDKFRAVDFGTFTTTRTRTPVAMNVEIGVTIGDGVLAIAAQRTDGAAQILPEKRTLLTYATEVAASTTLAMEYKREEDYSIVVGASGTITSAVTLQMATEF